jgi:hypothetical protein
MTAIELAEAQARDPGTTVAAALRERAGWAHLPSRPMRLAPPVALLGLLATAARRPPVTARWPYLARRHPRHPRTPAAGFPARPVAARQPASHPAGHPQPALRPPRLSRGAGHHRESRATIDPRSGHAIHCHAPGRVPSRGLLPGRGRPANL